eukprot:3246196-Alexandrium_andersonii.AAC.1
MGDAVVNGHRGLQGAGGARGPWAVRVFGHARVQAWGFQLRVDMTGAVPPRSLSRLPTPRRS